MQRPSALRFLPHRLFVGARPLSYLAVAWPVTTVPAMFLAGLVGGLVGVDAGPQFPQIGVKLFAMLVLVAPMLETLVMGSVLVLLQRLFGTGPAILLSAAGWGAVHSLQAPAWGLVIWWPFLIFSTAFLVWRARGFWRAWALVSALHALQNLIPASLIAIAA